MASFSSAEQARYGLGLSTHEEWASAGAVDAFVKRQSESISHGGMQVLRLIRFAGGALTVGIGFTDGLTSLDATSGEDT